MDNTVYSNVCKTQWTAVWACCHNGISLVFRYEMRFGQTKYLNYQLSTFYWLKVNPKILFFFILQIFLVTSDYLTYLVSVFWCKPRLPISLRLNCDNWSTTEICNMQSRDSQVRKKKFPLYILYLWREAVFLGL